jgi:hypothetical protein
MDTIVLERGAIAAILGHLFVAQVARANKPCQNKQAQTLRINPQNVCVMNFL